MGNKEQNNKDRDIDEIRKRKIIKGKIPGLRTLDIHENLKEMDCCPNCPKLRERIEALEQKNKILSKLKENEVVLAEAEVCKVFWIKEYNHLCFELGTDESLWISEKDFPSPGNYKLILTKSRGD